MRLPDWINKKKEENTLLWILLVACTVKAVNCLSDYIVIVYSLLSAIRENQQPTLVWLGWFLLLQMTCLDICCGKVLNVELKESQLMSMWGPLHKMWE